MLFSHHRSRRHAYTSYYLFSSTFALFFSLIAITSWRLLGSSPADVDSLFLWKESPDQFVVPLYSSCFAGYIGVDHRLRDRFHNREVSEFRSVICSDRFEYLTKMLAVSAPKLLHCFHNAVRRFVSEWNDEEVTALTLNKREQDVIIADLDSRRRAHSQRPNSSQDST
jgi:hypothetical protein